MFRARRWQELIDLIDALPEASRTREAMSRDPEYVRSALAWMEGRPQRVYRPAAHEYTSEVARLDALIDAVRENTIATIAAAGSNKLPKFDPRPRPESILDEIMHDARKERHERTVERVLGKRPSPSRSPEQVIVSKQDPRERHRRTVNRLMAGKIGPKDDTQTGR